MKRRNGAYALGVVLIVAQAGAYDTLITYTGGYQTGAFKLNGRPSLDSNRTDVPEKARFSIGLTVTHAGLPSCLTVCGVTHRTGILMQHAAGSSGFRNDSDIAWDSAAQFPAQLEALDSVMDPFCYSIIGRPSSYVGNGLVASVEQETNDCLCSRFGTYTGHNRIMYYRNGGIYLKLQVSGFEHDSSFCPRPPGGQAPHSKNVVFRYYLSNDGNFPPGPIPIRPFQKKMGAAGKSGWMSRFRDFFEMMRGRKPTVTH